MRTPVPDYLQQVLDECTDTADGEVADYIPELADVDPGRLGLAITLTDGETYAVGDADPFTIQSLSKPFAYALALRDRGLEQVLDRVGVDPSGDPFHQISLEEDGRPRNPMINIGALVTHALVGADDLAFGDRFERIRAGLSAFAGRELEVDEEVFASEFETSYRNRALANMVRHYGMVTQDPVGIVEEYTRQCSLTVTVRDLSVMAATLAAGGVNPVTGERVVEPWVARQVLSVMLTCGMYDSAGEWMTKVGMPAKSGVSGGVLGALPGQAGLAAFSPKLDEAGTSVRGARVFRRLSADMNMHLMEVAHVADSPIRTLGTRDVNGREASLLQLQGSLNFASMEFLLRRFEEVPDDTQTVVVDLTRVTMMNPVGQRMLAEGLRRLAADGREVTVIDPDADLAEVDLGEVRVLEEEPEHVREAVEAQPLD